MRIEGTEIDRLGVGGASDMGFFSRAPKKTQDLSQEIDQLRELRHELADVTAELKVTSRILAHKAQLAAEREKDGHDDD